MEPRLPSGTRRKAGRRAAPEGGGIELRRPQMKKGVPMKWKISWGGKPGYEARKKELEERLR